MNKFHLLLFGFMAMLMVVSCGRSSEKEDTSRSYTVIHKENSVHDSLYFEIDVEYPVFVCEDTLSCSFEKLNNAIDAYLDTAVHYYWGVDMDEVYAIIDETDTHGFFIFDNKYQITDSTKSHVSLVLNSYSYAMGAHGFTAITTFNFDIEKNQLISLPDLIDISTDEKAARLNKLLSENFINPDGCFVNEPTAGEDFQRFGMEPDSLVFYYEAYELGAYGCGQPVVKLSIEELEESGLWKMD
jgi:hypothetical protein